MKESLMTPRTRLLERNIKIERDRDLLADADLIEHYADAANQAPDTLERWFLDRDEKLPPRADNRPRRFLGAGPRSSRPIDESLLSLIPLREFLDRYVASPITKIDDEVARLNAARRTDRSPINYLGCRLEYGLRSAPKPPIRPVHWFWTRAEVVRAISAEPPAANRLADRLRDLLGLHYGRNVPLVVLLFPANHIDSAHIPSFIDAGGVRTSFVSWYSIDDDCGRSWDFKEAKPGVSEFVATACPLHRTKPDDGTRPVCAILAARRPIEVRYAGTTTGDAGEIQIDRINEHD
jgi:hypothetical protein